MMNTSVPFRNLTLFSWFIVLIMLSQLAWLLGIITEKPNKGPQPSFWAWVCEFLGIKKVKKKKKVAFFHLECFVKNFVTKEDGKIKHMTCVSQNLSIQVYVFISFHKGFCNLFICTNSSFHSTGVFFYKGSYYIVL